MKLILDANMVITPKPYKVKVTTVMVQEEKEVMGHSIQCAAGMRKSPLRLLRQATVHHPVIRNLLINIYNARANSKLIDQIDTGFCSGNTEDVKEAIKCEKLPDLSVEKVPDDESSEVSSTPSCDKYT